MAAGTVSRASLVKHAGFWRFDVKAIVGGVIMGILIILVQQVTERIDTVLTGGAFLVLGGFTFATLIAIASLFFRQPGGLIAGLIQAFVAVATALSPLAPAFIPINVGMSLVFSLVAWKLPMTTWWHHLIAQILMNFYGIIIGVGLALYFILKLPDSVILVSIGVTFVASVIGGTILTKLFSDALARSGLMD